jgi:phosphatidylinositol alpha-1,6-mannosyltransferase
MKWTLITHDYPPKIGGVARYLEALIKTCSCINLVQLDNLPGRISFLLLVNKYMTNSAGVITSHILPIGMMCYLSSKITNKPYIVILHGNDFDLARRNAWKRYISQKILLSAKTIITNSKALQLEVSDYTSRSDIVVVYPTIQDAFIESSNFIQAKHKNDERIQLLTIGRLVERKGFMKVLEVVKDDNTLSYTIVGDGPLKKQIGEYIQNNKLENRVKILSSISDRKLPDIYSKSDIFIMPTTKSQTDREGFGIVYIEAQLFGLPIIATNCPGVDEAVLHGKTGILIGGSLESIKTAIDNLKDPSSRSKFGNNGREFVKANFVREQQFNKFCKLLTCE